MSLRAAGGFGDKKTKEGSSIKPVAKVSADEKAADPKAALDADLAELRQAMGESKDFGSTTVKGFGDVAEVPSVPEKQVIRGRSLSAPTGRAFVSACRIRAQGDHGC